ncbi:MAG: HesA/MoeB/ThiF family protein [Alphaproteobacteria bacterium]|nr:HesA/MoeB/ThiF family protein [Alphaproteobacteria bacterium]
MPAILPFPASQKRSKINCWIHASSWWGAGGLGATALPALAGAGVGHITILDHDKIARSNLHRQTIYRDTEVGKHKAEIAAEYLHHLNPDIEIVGLIGRLQDVQIERRYDLVLDGTDNFAAKNFLNEWAIETKTPLISASVHQFTGQSGLFAGHEEGAPCYRCLFPELPDHAPDCSTAGVLGSASGMMGLLQAHMALLYLTGLGDTKPGDFMQVDFLNLRLTKLEVSKNPACPFCGDERQKSAPDTQACSYAPLVAYNDLPHDAVIVDVREAEELEIDPIPGALHIPLMQVPQRLDELPDDKPLAFVCAGNIRSRHAADYLSARGFSNILVLDKFSL